MLYDAATGAKQTLFTAAAAPEGVDRSEAQWSPQADMLLLSGGAALWLLDLATGELRPLLQEGEAKTNVCSQVNQLQASPLLIHGLTDRNVHLQNTVNFLQALEAADKPFAFIPLPNLDHSFHGDGLVAALAASTDYFAHCLGQ